MQILNIAIAADNNYLPYAAICLKSLFLTNLEFEKINVHLIGNNLSEASIKNFSTIFNQEKYILNIYSISDIENRLQIAVPKTIAITSYARLFISSLLPNDIDKVLYIDCDIIFNGSIFNFYNTDLGDKWVGGVLDTFMNTRAKDEIGIPHNEPYLNAGVLLIPLSKWRLLNIENKFIQFLLQHNGIVYHHDQGIINAVCQGEKMIFPPKFNATSFYFSHPYRILARNNTPFYTKEEVMEAKKNPIIIHFTCGYLNRPWIKNCKHPYLKLFNKYKQQTEYAKLPILPDKRRLRERMDSIVFLYMPFGIFSIYSKIIDKLGSLKKMFIL